MRSTFILAGLLAFVARSVLRPGRFSPVHRRKPLLSLAGPPPPPIPPQWPTGTELFATKFLQFPIDAKQTEILAGPREQSRRVVVCCSRQWGKSTTAAIKALHHALITPNSLTLIASRTRHQAAELLEKSAQFARSLELPARRVPGHAASLLLPNSSRIIAIPGRPASIRGYSAVSLLIIDEAAYVPDSLYEALRPMLATTNGAIWLLSTPNGRKGFFFREWSDASETWRKISVPANECSRISAEFLAEERRKNGPAIFEREYLCKFLTSGDTYFDVDAMEASAAAAESPAQLGQSYLSTRFFVGFDLGQKSTPSAIVLLEKVLVVTKERDPVTWSWIQRTEIHLLRAERLPLNMTYEAIAAKLRSVIRSLPNAKNVTLVMDATGCGAPFVDLLRKQPVGALTMPVTITASGAPSMTNGAHRISKTDLMKSLNYLISSPDFKINAPAEDHRAIMQELQNIRMLSSTSGAMRFTSSEQDDLVMALALAAWPARKFLVPRQP